MGAIIAAVVGALFKSVADYVNSWFAAKQAKENEWAARSAEAQLQSFKDGKAVEVQIEEAQKEIPKPQTVSDLQHALGYCVVLCVLPLFLCGCFELRVTVKEYKPEIKTEPPSQEMFIDPDVPLTKREQAMGQYTVKLKTAIDKYNTWAKTENVKNGYAADIVPVPGTVTVPVPQEKKADDKPKPP